MSLLVCNVTAPSWQWQFRLCVALQWAAGGAFPIEINFLCSLGMVGWKVSFWSSARQAYFISPGRKHVSQISLLTRRLWGKRHDFWIQGQSIFPNRNLFPRESFPWMRMNGIHIRLGFPKWDLVTVPQKSQIPQKQGAERPSPGGRGWGASELAERAMRQGHRSWGDTKAESSVCQDSP